MLRPINYSYHFKDIFLYRCPDSIPVNDYHISFSIFLALYHTVYSSTKYFPLNYDQNGNSAREENKAAEPILPFERRDGLPLPVLGPRALVHGGHRASGARVKASQLDLAVWGQGYLGGPSGRDQCCSAGPSGMGSVLLSWT